VGRDPAGRAGPTTGAAEERLTVLDGGSYRIVRRGDGVLGLAIPQPRAELWDVYCTTPDRCGLVSEATSLADALAAMMHHNRVHHEH